MDTNNKRKPVLKLCDRLIDLCKHHIESQQTDSSSDEAFLEQILQLIFPIAGPNRYHTALAKLGYSDISNFSKFLYQQHKSEVL